MSYANAVYILLNAKVVFENSVRRSEAKVRDSGKMSRLESAKVVQ
jgi:hypothetical protein